MENNIVFVDANFFVALANVNDPLYSKAIEIAQDLGNPSVIKIISNYIFLEITTVLSLRVGREAAINSGTKILNDKSIKVINVDDFMHNKSWEVFKNEERKNLSFVDCSIIALMSYFGFTNLLSFDNTDFVPLAKKYNFNLYGYN